MQETDVFTFAGRDDFDDLKQHPLFDERPASESFS